MSAPLQFTQDKRDELLRDLAQGVPLSEICRRPHMPCRQQVHRTKDADEEFGKAFEEAKLLGYEFIAEDSLAIVDEAPKTFVTETGATRIDPADVANRKLRVEHRLKLLAKWDPKRFGDRMTLAGDPEAPLANVTDDQVDARIAALMAKTKDAPQ